MYIFLFLKKYVVVFRRFGSLSSTCANLIVSSTEAVLRRQRYSDLSMTTIPEPLSGLVIVSQWTPTETLVDKAFTNYWFNQTYYLNLEKEELTQLLEVATSNQLFQFNVQLYEQTDGVAMGSPLGPLMANVFMCHLEDKLAGDGMIPSLYKRYVDDTLARMPNTDCAADFLTTLNGLHLCLKFTMELPADNMIPFIGLR